MKILSKETYQSLQDLVKDTAEKIGTSDCFFCAYNKKLLRDPKPVIELGTAMLLDKPIYFLVRHGDELPENLRKVARHIEYFEEGNRQSMNDAAIRIAKIVKSEGGDINRGFFR